MELASVDRNNCLLWELCYKTDICHPSPATHKFMQTFIDLDLDLDYLKNWLENTSDN